MKHMSGLDLVQEAVTGLIGVVTMTERLYHVPHSFLLEGQNTLCIMHARRSTTKY